MGGILDKLDEWLRGLLIEGITGNLSGMFDTVNTKVGEIAGEVGQTPLAWNSGVFSMIRNLSETVIVPIAGVILTFVMCYELIQLVTEKNNLHDVDTCISEDGKKLFAPEKEVIGTCPRCGQPVYEGKKNFACSDRSCGFVLWKNDRFWTSRKKELTKKMATDLLKKGRTNVKGMWSEKKQAAYDAAVILDDTGGKYINFKLEFPKRKEGVNGRK